MLEKIVTTNDPCSERSRTGRFSPVAIALMATLISGGTMAYTVSQLKSSEKARHQATPVIVKPTVVTALGRLEPEGEVIKLSAPVSGEGSRVEKLLVKEGDRVKTNQIVAILDNYDRLSAALLQAQQQVAVAQANLAKVKAGAKTGEINAKQAEADRIAVEAQNEMIAQRATIAKINAEKDNEAIAQAATMKRIEVERTNEMIAQKATIDRIKAERSGEISAQQAIIARLTAERDNEIDAQTATIARIKAEMSGDQQMETATINRLEAELANAEIEHQRYQQLYQEGVISASQRDAKDLALAAATQRLIAAQADLEKTARGRSNQLAEAQSNLTKIQLAKQEQINEAQANLSRMIASRQQQINEAQANLNKIISSRDEQLNEAQANLQKITSVKLAQLAEAEANLQKISQGRLQQLNAAKSTLESIAEVRPVDITIAEAEVKQAEANVQQAAANLAKAQVRSTRDAQILKIYTKPGEIISNNGILEMGSTQQMYAVAEVYESDLSQVKIGQKVNVTSEAITGKLEGTVEQIGLQVKKQNVINTDTSANIDNRIVEVKIRLDQKSSQRVSNLTNLQVRVQIQL